MWLKYTYRFITTGAIFLVYSFICMSVCVCDNPRSKEQISLKIKLYEGIQNKIWIFTKNVVTSFFVQALCRCSTGADRPVAMHFWRVGTNVYMVG